MKYKDSIVEFRQSGSMSEGKVILVHKSGHTQYKKGQILFQAEGDGRKLQKEYVKWYLKTTGLVRDREFIKSLLGAL